MELADIAVTIDTVQYEKFEEVKGEGTHESKHGHSCLNVCSR